MSAGSHSILVRLWAAGRYTLMACNAGGGIYFDKRASRGLAEAGKPWLEAPRVCSPRKGLGSARMLAAQAPRLRAYARRGLAELGKIGWIMLRQAVLRGADAP